MSLFLYTRSHLTVSKALTDPQLFPLQLPLTLKRVHPYFSLSSLIMPLPNPVRCTKKPRAKASSSSSKSKPRLPPDLQSRILLAFFDNLFDQGGIRVDEKLFQLSRLSLVCREWSAIVRPEYVKWVAFELRMKGMQRDGGKQPFDAEIIEAQLNNLRQARCLCCYTREGLRIALDNPSGTSLVARERIWKKALEKILVEYRKCPQFQLDLADAESGEYVDIIWRFIRTLSPISLSLKLPRTS